MTEPHARAVAAIGAYFAAHADQGEHGISGREIVSIIAAAENITARTAEEERADVVAWLTKIGWTAFAPLIERGEHIDAAKKGQS